MRSDMAFQEDFTRALRETDVRRERRSRLLTVGSTELPYVLLSASVDNQGDTAVRRGLVRVESPTLLLLNRPLLFEGFEDDGGGDDTLRALGRGAVPLPGAPRCRRGQCHRGRHRSTGPLVHEPAGVRWENDSAIRILRSG